MSTTARVANVGGPSDEWPQSPRGLGNSGNLTAWIQLELSAADRRLGRLLSSPTAWRYPPPPGDPAAANTGGGGPEGVAAAAAATLGGVADLSLRTAAVADPAVRLRFVDKVATPLVRRLAGERRSPCSKCGRSFRRMAAITLGFR